MTKYKMKTSFREKVDLRGKDCLPGIIEVGGEPRQKNEDTVSSSTLNPRKGRVSPSGYTVPEKERSELKTKAKKDRRVRPVLVVLLRLLGIPCAP